MLCCLGDRVVQGHEQVFRELPGGRHVPGQVLARVADREHVGSSDPSPELLDRAHRVGLFPGVGQVPVRVLEDVEVGNVEGDEPEGLTVQHQLIALPGHEAAVQAIGDAGRRDRGGGVGGVPGVARGVLGVLARGV